MRPQKIYDAVMECTAPANESTTDLGSTGGTHSTFESQRFDSYCKAQSRNGFKLVLANKRDRWERVFRLAQQVYEKNGFRPFDDSLCTSPYDVKFDTLSYLVFDELSGKDVGTISHIGDSSDGLPCDEIFADELNGLRAKGRKLAEVSRLAISNKEGRSKDLLVLLMHWVSVSARTTCGVDDFIIEVHPGHVNYYRRILRFEVIGSQRSCPRVGGSPAVLLRLDLHLQKQIIARVGGTECRSQVADGRTLYPYFFNASHENSMDDYIRVKRSTMSADDREYFNLHAMGSRKFDFKRKTVLV